LGGGGDLCLPPPEVFPVSYEPPNDFLHACNSGSSVFRVLYYTFLLLFISKMQIVTGQTNPELDYTGFSNYDAANMLERASQLKLVQFLRRPSAASYNENFVYCFLKWNASLVLKLELTF